MGWPWRAAHPAVLAASRGPGRRVLAFALGRSKLPGLAASAVAAVVAHPRLQAAALLLGGVALLHCQIAWLDSQDSSEIEQAALRQGSPVDLDPVSRRVLTDAGRAVPIYFARLSSGRRPPRKWTPG